MRPAEIDNNLPTCETCIFFNNRECYKDPPKMIGIKPDRPRVEASTRGCSHHPMIYTIIQLNYLEQVMPIVKAINEAKEEWITKNVQQPKGILIPERQFNG